MKNAEQNETLVVSPGPRDGTVRCEGGAVLRVPSDWELLPPGDATLTRRVKAGGPSWTVKVKKGRRTFSQGVWADAARIQAIRAELAKERSTEAYAKRRESEAKRRNRQQAAYVEQFRSSVLEFLNFAPRYAELSEQLAQAVAEHATPVGSGTVARTQRIPIQQRAEAAVIAWMRHQTTAYDQMKIARVNGRRREVRRMLADHSRQLLQDYRDGRDVTAANCPLQQALKGSGRLADQGHTGSASVCWNNGALWSGQRHWQSQCHPR